MLFFVTSARAPRPSASARPSLPIIVVGTLQTASGLGQSARLSYLALQEAGVPVYGIDLTAELMQPVDLPFAFRDGRSLEGPATLLVHINGPLMPLAMMRLGRAIVGQRFVTGYWAWELPRLAPDWAYGVPFVHSILTPSRFVADAVAPFAKGRPVEVLHHPVALRSVEPASRERNDPAETRPFTALTFFNMTSTIARKNPLAAVAAFRRAFGDGEDARLIVKVSNLDAYPAGAARLRDAVEGASNIEIIDAIMDHEALDALYLKSDALLSLHRAEGFGLPVAEAMLRGLPAIATDWSGSVDFLTDETGMPVPCDLVPVDDPQGVYGGEGMAWAEPDVEAAAEALRRLKEDPDLRVRLGKQAEITARKRFSAAHYGDRLLSILRRKNR